MLDLSGVYYNPGSLSLIDTDAVELLMFAKVFHYPTTNLSVSDWDLYHIIGGTTFLKGILGISF